MDRITRFQRSENMARIRSRKNKSTELKLRGAMIQSGLRGWKMNRRDILGSPDFVFYDSMVTVFVDGCFWHGCPKCKLQPKSNTDYWDRKLKRNKARDLYVSRNLRTQGWKVVRIWECNLRASPQLAIRRILRKL